MAYNGFLRASPPVNIQVFTGNNSSYTKATDLALGATYIDIMMCGGGGGGGGGSVSSAGGAGPTQGGGGGSGGEIIIVRGIPLSALAASQPFNRGDGGGGGIGVTRMGNGFRNGMNGFSGDSSTFYIYRANGGARGLGGNLQPAPVPGQPSVVRPVGLHSPTYMVFPSYGAPQTVPFVPGCGGGGGAWPTLRPECNATVTCNYLAAPAATAAAAQNSPGADGVLFATYFGTGGAAGVGNFLPTGDGWQGGDGTRGGGGGGGSSCRNDARSGGGGGGGNGWLVVFAY